jgi:hypothetical protein
MARDIFKTRTKISPKMEQVTVDVYMGIGNLGEAGQTRSQADVNPQRNVVNVRRAGGDK